MSNAVRNAVCNAVTHAVHNAARTHVQNQTRSRVLLTQFCGWSVVTQNQVVKAVDARGFLALEMTR